MENSSKEKNCTKESENDMKSENLTIFNSQDYLLSIKPEVEFIIDTENDGAEEHELETAAFEEVSKEQEEYILKEDDSYPFVCEKCKRTFQDSTTLKLHMRIHEDKPFKCDKCTASFAIKARLTIHQRLHTGIKPFQCEYCGAAFSQKTNLVGHRRLHTGEKPYKCDICPAKFALSSNLKKHRLVHTNEKPYTCNICGAGFRQVSNLKSHERAHSRNSLRFGSTKKREKVCEECGLLFTNIAALEYHQQIHTGPIHKCHNCGLGFNQLTDLKNHYRCHLDLVTYACSMCTASFKKKTTLKAHMIKKHPDEGIRALIIKDQNATNFFEEEGTEIAKEVVIYIDALDEILT